VAAVPILDGDEATAIFGLVHFGVADYAHFELRVLYERAEHAVRHDLLTGLPNYRFLQDRLSNLKTEFEDTYHSAVLPLGLGAMSSVWLGALAAFTVLVVISRGAMSLGDTKVGAYCGAIVGLQGVAPMLMFTFLGDGLISLGLVATRIRSRSDAMVFTPFMLVAVVAVVAVVATLWLGAANT